jgi:ubiquinone/menaquinone biosynthesis C-methylase UbiE
MFQKTNYSQLIDANLLFKRAGIGDKMKVADLGCGSSGQFVFGPAKLVGERGKVYAVDIMKTVLETVSRRASQENAKNVFTIWTNLEIFGATKIESGSLDVAMLINTLYQSHKRLEILRESIRMMKNKGKLMVVEWKNMSIPFGPPVEERVNAEQLILVLTKLGLKLEDEFEAGPYHYGLIFEK